MGDWTFFSNYGHVLVCLARHPKARLRDVAAQVGITERAVQKIVRDLQDAGFLTVTKQGRCNRYRINKRKSLRHTLESHCTVGKLLALLARPDRADTVESSAQGVAAVAAANVSGREGPVPERTTPVPLSVTADAKREQAERKAREDAQKKEKKRAPVDTREQGSLF